MKNKGITLIALVITIIVLIILAGVTINIVFDNNGIISKTKEAARLAQEEGAKEKVDMLLAEYEIKSSTEGISLTDFFVAKKEAEEISDFTDAIDYITIEVDGYEFTIDKNTKEITNVADTNIRITIAYPEGTVGQTAKATVTVTNNKETVDGDSLVYGWSDSTTTEPGSWTSFVSDQEITYTVGNGEIWYLWIKGNYEGGNSGTESKKVSKPFSYVDITPPTGSVSYNPSTSTVDPVVVTITTSEEIQVPSGWTKTSATTYTKTYTRNTNEPIAMTDGVGNIGSVNVSIMNIYVLPTGFTASTVSGEITTDEGKVIKGPDGSEFVWVPVPNPVLDVQGMDNTQINTAIAAEVTAGRYPMAIKVSGTDYKGVLYKFTLDKSTTPNGVTITPLNYTNADPGAREPGVVVFSETTYDNVASYYTDAGITGITTSEQFKTQLQSEYNAMVTSVVAKGGFYIGRYETSTKSGNVVQSKKGVAPLGSISWYRLYQRQKAYASNNSITSVKSAMVYGSAWDQMMIWMKDIRNANASNSPFIVDSTGMGYYADFSVGLTTTGVSTNYKIYNIFDIAGNMTEATQAVRANGTSPSSTRICHGSRYYATGLSAPASVMDMANPDTITWAYLGSRLLLY